MKKLAKLFTIIFATIGISISTYSQETGTFVDKRDGQIYKTVKINNQVWMAENLNFDAGEGSWGYADKLSNEATYGRLYNWTTACKVCPAGWKLPSNDEWSTLECSLGMKVSEINKNGRHGKGIGTKLRSANGWKGINNTNTSGFSALPGGCIIGNKFFYIGNKASFWTSTENKNSALILLIPDNDKYILRMAMDKVYGQSVRCIKDESWYEQEEALKFEELAKEYTKDENKKSGSKHNILSDTIILNDKSEVNDLTINRTDNEKEEQIITPEDPLNMISTGILNPSSLVLTFIVGLGDFYLLEYEHFFNQKKTSLSANINTSFGLFSSSTYWYNVGYGLTFRLYKLLPVGFGLNFLNLKAVNIDTDEEESLGIFLEPKIEVMLLAPGKKKGFNIRGATEIGYVLGDIIINGETEYIGTLGSNNFTFSLTFYIGIGW